MKLKTVYESGTVYNFSNCSVYVPTDVDDPDEAANQAKTLNQPEDEVTRLESDRGDLRSSSERIELLALLRDRSDDWHFEHKDVSDHPETPEHPRVPVGLVAEGKASVAAYLAVAGLDNDEIADWLDVGRRTVSQYITDFKQGER